MGGDEFVIVFTDPDPDQLLASANRIVERIALPIDLADGPRFVGASAGVAIGAAADAAELLSRADDASYRSKRSGGSRVVSAHSGPAGEP
jgi:GGDEF domain-containing protein